MPKRISVDIEGFETKLEKLAEMSDRKVAQEARNILRQGVEKRFADLINGQDTSLSSQFLRALASEQLPDEKDLILLSRLVNVPFEVLLLIRDSYLDKVQNRDREDGTQ